VRTAARAHSVSWSVSHRGPGAGLVGRPIYLAFACDGSLHDIGKVDRTSGAVGARLSEHLRMSLRRRRVWRTLWVVPIGLTIDPGDLLSLERSLIRHHRRQGHAAPRGLTDTVRSRGRARGSRSRMRPAARHGRDKPLTD
jgi:hypothetical protein